MLVEEEWVEAAKWFNYCKFLMNIVIKMFKKIDWAVVTEFCILFIPVFQASEEIKEWDIIQPL